MPVPVIGVICLAVVLLWVVSFPLRREPAIFPDRPVMIASACVDAEQPHVSLAEFEPPDHEFGRKEILPPPAIVATPTQPNRPPVLFSGDWSAISAVARSGDLWKKTTQPQV